MKKAKARRNSAVQRRHLESMRAIKGLNNVLCALIQRLQVAISSEQSLLDKVDMKLNQFENRLAGLEVMVKAQHENSVSWKVERG